ncbi:hypothetical protein CHH57_01475 [Niallia circulans]|uniref:Pectate lyase superfamily protein domain-containing protein n=1 Tax=Niallia circulans TaxID=1397 RepID=A0AA91TW34_NIACI|nr:hypothetical protein [Niallia circulans]PAD85008.1 hypothetical protein CHH57_01475 [Niallia circulans]
MADLNKIPKFMLGDDVHQEFNNTAIRIEDINTNVLSLGAKGDGVTDETTILQSIFNSLPFGSRVSFPHKKVFKITRPLIITRDDIHIDFNGSKLLYAGTESLDSDNGTGRIYGAITVRGELIDSTKTNVVDIISNEGIIDQEFYSNGDNFKGLKQPFTQVTKIITDNTAIGNVIKKGDFVSVYVRNHSGTWDKNYGDNPSMLNAIARVIYVDAANVYIDVCSDLRFNPDKVNGNITLLKPVNNVTIENLIFEDINDTPIPSTITDNSERDSWVAGISVRYATNFTLLNYKASKHRFPALMMRNVYNPIIDNFLASYARTVTAGCGYGMQIMSSVHGSIKNVRGYFLRHLIDFTSSGHMRVENARMINDWHGAFDCHGMGEFDITYVNCVGNFLASNGINEFPDMVGNISLDNCKGSLQMAWAQRIHVNNSLIYMDAMRVTKSPHIEILNSKLVFKRTKYNFAAAYRGVYMQTAFILDNTSIEITNENNPRQEWTNKLFEIDAYKKVRISNVPYVRNLRSDVMLITIAKCTDTTINDSILTNLGFNLTNTTSIGDDTVLASNSMAAGVLRIKNSKFDESINASDAKNFFAISNVDDISSYLIILDGNMFYSMGKMRWIRTEINSFNVNIIAVNNLFRGKVGAFYKAGLMEPTFIAKDGNIDLSETDEPTRLKNYNVPRISLSIPTGWTEYKYLFTPERLQPDTDYDVYPFFEWDYGSWWLESKSTTGYTIKFSKSPTTTSKLTMKVTR